MIRLRYGNRWLMGLVAASMLAISTPSSATAAVTRIEVLERIPYANGLLAEDVPRLLARTERNRPRFEDVQE